MAPIIAALLQQGFSILGGALLSKGKEVVEEKLGIDIDKALGSEEGRIKLKQLESEHEQWLIEADIRKRDQELEFQKAQESGITDRWKADMGSDSWLAKTVRPMTLIYLLTAYTILSLLSGFGFNVASAYVELLGQWGMLVMTAYFGGRTLEKIVSTREGAK